MAYTCHVFRKIDGELWLQARARARLLNLKFLDVVQGLLRDWLRMTSEPTITRNDVVPRVIRESIAKSRSYADDK